MSEPHNNSTETLDRVLPRYFTPKQVAQQLQISVSMVQRYAQTGQLPGVKIGRHWRFPVESLQKFLGQAAHA